MKRNRSVPDAAIIPELAYPDVRAAAAWLCEAFGFRERLRIGDHRVQLTFEGGALVVTERDPSHITADSDHATLVRVDDVDAVRERAVERGARAVREPADYPFGERQCTLVDPHGHRWTFTQTIVDVDPRDWGGELV